MKKAMFVAAAVTLVAAIANGAAVQFYDLGVNSVSNTVSSNGQYVAGSVIDSSVAAYRVPTYWAVDLAGGTAPVRTIFNTANGIIGGMSVGSNGTVYVGVNMGGTTAAENTGRAGTTAGVNYLLDHNGASSNVLVAANNGVEAALDGSGVYVAGDWTKGNDGQFWKYDGTSASANPLGHPVASPGGNVVFRSISGTGIAVGGDKGGVGPTGAINKDRAVFATAAAPNTLQFVPVFENNVTCTQGIGYDISSNGNYVTGLMYKFSDAIYKGFVWDKGANAAYPTMLTATPGLISSTYVVGYAVADDGAVAGNVYADDNNQPGGIAGGHDMGTIWFPGETVGVRMVDILRNQGLSDDLPSDFRSIGRLYSIASLGGGQYAVSGEASYWTGADTYATRGFFAVVPEPATALFVAFGGLALLRRRR